MSHLQWQMLGRLPQVVVLLIDRCCITIQTIIPVSQLPLWVLRRAGAVLPQWERGVGTERRHRGTGASPARLQGTGAAAASPGPAPGQICRVSAGRRTTPELDEHGLGLGAAQQQRATLLCVADPCTRPKSSRVSESFKRVGILVLAVVLTLACLVAIGFLVKIYLDHHYLFCKQPLKLVPLKQVCDGQLDCLQGEDEANCPQWVPEGPPARARVSKDRSILQVLNSNTGAWSCVCHDHFTPALARAACEQMGYSSTPTFHGVEVGAGQLPPPYEVVLSNGSIQVLEPGRKCLSGLVVSLFCSTNVSPHRLRAEREDAAGAGGQPGCHRDVALAGQFAVQEGAHLRGQHHRARLGPDGRALLQEQPHHPELACEGRLRPPVGRCHLRRGEGVPGRGDTRVPQGQ
ncbi:PREDICTED: transmembrane protease serine 4 isoform X3 [Corvus brachyrhynchos]|uniref:transmembrane protease serine 4 isoform X3 n=1 Tax=Corvus brachyrhynchos TaxID=85066 RepID=UPI0008166A04|nr:PREDICTED: transmembrane protease serine 4 isoform X3 [Corvus brachyrhynchos]